MSFGKGRILAQPGSDATPFLEALKKALEAKKIPKNTPRVASIPFTYAVLGENMSRDANGFGDKPGHWMPMKIFFNEDENESEVFLNLNPLINKGEFAIKDEDYGDLVLSELAKVL